MDMDFLRGLGLGEEAAGKVLAQAGQELARAQGALKKKEGELREAAAAREKGGQEAAALRQRLGEAEKKYAAAQLQGAIDLALARAGARSLKAARALLDGQGLRLADGEVQGLPERVARLRQEAPYLFLQALEEGARVDTGLAHGRAAEAGPQTLAQALGEYYG